MKNILKNEDSSRQSHWTKQSLLIALQIIFSFSMLIPVSPAIAQDNSEVLQNLVAGDSADIHTLAMYPDSIRRDIFETASHPEGVTRLGDSRNRSNESFRKLMEPFPKEEQTKIWNLTRYNNLISRLVHEGNGKQKKIDKVLLDYPQEIHDDALEYALHDKELLVGINRIQTEFNQSVDNDLKEYALPTQRAFRSLLNYPEIISLLNSNMHMTVTLGDIYRKTPDLVIAEFSSLNLELARQKARDLEEWKQTVNENPDTKNELKESATDYANENGYHESDYRETDPIIIEHYIYRPYPFWCGYPMWYEYDYWYPYPWWYHSGFYYYHGDIVILGPPSWYYMRWHFRHHHYFQAYPHLTNAYVGYYYGPRRAVVSNSVVVTQWVHENQRDLPTDFITNKDNRIESIREFGKLGESVDDFNRKNPDKPIEKRDYLLQNVKDYPHLKSVVIPEQNPEPVVVPETERTPVTNPVKSNPREIRTITPGNKIEQIQPREQQTFPSPVEPRNQEKSKSRDVITQPRHVPGQEPAPPKQITQPKSTPQKGNEQKSTPREIKPATPRPIPDKRESVPSQKPAMERKVN